MVSAEADGQKAGCVINTATQVTAEPPRMMVAVHKDNVTTGVIKSAGAFTVTAIDMTADMPYIGNFGLPHKRELRQVREVRLRDLCGGEPLFAGARVCRVCLQAH